MCRPHSFSAFPAPTWIHALLNPWTHEPGFLKNLLKNLSSVSLRPSVYWQTNTPAGLTHPEPLTATQSSVGEAGCAGRPRYTSQGRLWHLEPNVKLSEKSLGRSVKLNSPAVSARSLQLFGPQLLPCKMITQGPARWSLRLLLTHPQ